MSTKLIVGRSFVLIPAFMITAACSAAPTGSEGAGGASDKSNEVVLDALAGSHASEGVQTQDVHGGTGGEWSFPRCSTIVGLDGRSATYIDQIQLVCEDGTNVRFPGPKAPIWTNGGYAWPQALACPDGFIATGVLGAATTYVDRIGLICRRLTDMNDVRTTNTYGGGWNHPYYEDCWDAHPPASAGMAKLGGINVRGGSWVDAIAPVCVPFNERGAM